MREPGKRARQKLERPGEILAAARDSFVQNGYAATRLEDVASTIGITKGTIYVYFETKEALFEAVVRAYSPSFELEFHASDAPVIGQLAGYLEKIHKAIAEDEATRDIFNLLIAEGRHFPRLTDAYFAEFFAPALATIRQLLDLGVRRGELRASALIDYPELLFSPSVMGNVWSVIFGERKPIDQNRFLAAWIETLLRGLAVPSS